MYHARGHDDPVLRDRVVRIWIESELGRLMSLRAAQLGQTGDPGPVGSVGKLLGAEHALRVHELLVALLGADGMLYPELGADGAPGVRTDHVSSGRVRSRSKVGRRR